MNVKNVSRATALAYYVGQWNTATAPYVPRTDTEHKRMRRYAKAIEKRMSKMGFRFGVDYKEFSNGMLWPI